ncbi:sensor histidine kinase [Nocardiopsis synnemataformans]|uniref:sensor histidine kinase n=1 Tax=Nocardiopsis synnemataformans TaxID=61305 RepID=UPI003EB76089
MGAPEHDPDDARFRGLAALAPVAALLLVTGCALLVAMDGGHDPLVPVWVSCVGFALVAVVFGAQVHGAALSRRSSARYWLLGAQAVLTVLLVADGWLWHGTTGLLAGAVLSALRPGAGVPVASALTAAVPVVSWLLALSPEQLAHWLACHTGVGLGAWVLVRLVSLVRLQWRGHREAVQNARERERAQIASGLHDVLGRTLVAIALKGEAVHGLVERAGRSQTGPGSQTGPEPWSELRRQVRGLVDLVRDARADVRSAVASSWSTTLVEEVALAGMVLADASVDWSADVRAEEVPPGAEWVLAAALREAVTNALVHSRATRVRLSVGVADGCAVLRVANDGADPEAVPVVYGTGLRGVAARCFSVGGRAGTEVDPEGWFVLTCRVPVE